MNLAEIRRRFVEHSGRYDLVIDSEKWEDDGANSFIRSGQRLLDQLLDSPKSKAVQIHHIDKGQKQLRLRDCRSITDVWIVDDKKDKFLDRIYFRDFKKHFGLSHDEGVPKCFAVEDIRGNRNNRADLIHLGILIGPVPNIAYDMYVRGKFYSSTMMDDEDFCFWSVEYPDTIVQAAMYQLEKVYRNTSGMNDHMNAIMRTINNIDNDQVEMEITQRSTMNDSFNERAWKRGL